jgi:hypothetical protein
MPVLRYIDIVLIVVAAPILLLIGVSPSGYLAGGVAWIVLRVVGVGAEHLAEGMSDQGRAIGIRLGFMLARLFLLALAVILVRQHSGQGAGLAALCVIVFAFTVSLGLSAATRPRSR